MLAVYSSGRDRRIPFQPCVVDYALLRDLRNAHLFSRLKEQMHETLYSLLVFVVRLHTAVDFVLRQPLTHALPQGGV